MSDVMLFGVLKMPYEMAMSSELSRLQFYQRVQQLVARVEAQPEQEPVAWEQFYPDIGKPQLKQEPVAIYRAGQAKGEGFHVEFLKEMGDDEVLLYTTPPKRPWVGLTDEEMDKWIEEEHDVLRWVEAKLKEKNT